MYLYFLTRLSSHADKRREADRHNNVLYKSRFAASLTRLQILLSSKMSTNAFLMNLTMKIDYRINRLVYAG